MMTVEALILKSVLTAAGVSLILQEVVLTV